MCRISRVYPGNNIWKNILDFVSLFGHGYPDLLRTGWFTLYVPTFSQPQMLTPIIGLWLWKVHICARGHCEHFGERCSCFSRQLSGVTRFFRAFWDLTLFVLFLFYSRFFREFFDFVCILGMSIMWPKAGSLGNQPRCDNQHAHLGPPKTGEKCRNASWCMCASFQNLTPRTDVKFCDFVRGSERERYKLQIPSF